MEIFKCLLIICLKLASNGVLVENLTEVPNEPNADFVFDLPDIVASLETIWGEVQLEAFGARQVNELEQNSNNKFFC
jgi:hypothetical protein